MLNKDNETKFSTRIIRLNITKVLCFKLKRHSNTNAMACFCLLCSGYDTEVIILVYDTEMILLYFFYY